MSISPIDAQRSSKSSSSRGLSQSPNSTHGLLPLPDLAGSSDDVGDVRSMHISASEFDFENSGSVAAAAADSRWSSEKMIDLGTQDVKQATYCQHRGSFPLSPLAGGGGTSSQLKFDQSKHAHLKGKQSKPNSPSHFEQQPPSDFGVTHSSATTHSAGRRNQMMNANHLLNFQYDPIARPLPRPLPPRKPHKIKPYNKDLFLQANFKFVVLDSGNYVMESMDPDKMLEWEDIVCVKYSTPFPVQCPICLETPLCPQITSCGHIFCFPCILRYLLMGKEDHKGDCWKKCPLCFMVISSKELYTIYINYVKQYHIGDNVEFALLTRAKDSLIPSQKDRSGDNVIDDFFSKITFTSDVELAVREAHMELNDWLAKADCGLMDDLEQLPYVCAAREQLEERKKHWAENQTLSSSPPLHATTTNRGSKFISNKTYTHVFSSVGSTEAPAHVTLESVQGRSCSGYQDELKGSDVPSLEKLGGEDCSESLDGLPDAFHTPEKSVLSYEEGINMQKNSGDYKDVKDAYTFYQAVDGQHLILHSLNMKCLLHHYGSHDLLPSRIGGKILQLETVTQSEAMRRRYRYLSHFSLTTIFQLCEIDMSDILPPDAISPFMDEIKKRRNQRKRLAKKENVEQARAEAAAMHAIPISSNVRRSSSNDAIFSIDDFEALGNSTVPSTSPSVAGDKKLFSHVTRLGFASAHDSPSLRMEETVDALNNKEATDEAANLTGLRGPAMSFANIISADKYASPSERGAKVNALGKKGKKPSRVLLSTAGGRRY